MKTFSAARARYQPGVFVLTLGCLLCAAVLLVCSNTVSEGARAGLALCSNVVIPSLFPFLVLAGFMSGSAVCGFLGRLFAPVTRLLFRLPPEAAVPLLLGVTGGYPVGARALAQLTRSGRMPPKTAGRMLCFCVNAGPSFLLCAVGAGMLGSLTLGALLFAAQAVSSLLLGVVLGLFARREAPEPQAETPSPSRSLSLCFVQSVGDACAAMLSICAFVVLFSALSALLSATGLTQAVGGWLCAVFPSLDPRLPAALLTGLLEVTSGCGEAAPLGYGGLCAIAALISFSGVSVLFQVLAAVQGSGIPTRGFLLSRPVHGALTLAVFLLLLRLFPQALTVFSALPAPLRVTAGSAEGAASLLAMCAVFLLTVGRGKGLSRYRLSYTGNTHTS